VKGVLGRLLRFGLVGGVATGIQYVILVVLVHEGVSPAVASAIGFVVSAFGNYLLNYHFTFRSRESHGPAATKFVTLAAGGLVINFVLMHVLVGAGWYYLLAQVLVTAVVFMWNFVGNSVWTFRAYTGP
jgi:putative flippase GtrA